MKTASPPKYVYLSHLFLVLMLAILPVRPANAQPLGINFKDLPKVKDYPVPADFIKKTKAVSDTAPYKEESIAYSINIPKGWTDNIQSPPVDAEGNTARVSDTVLGILARHVGTPNNLLRSYVLIEGQGLAYEISALHWFVNFILINGFSLQALSIKSPKEVEALYVQVDKDQTYVVRTRVLVNGNRLVMVRYYLPQENYNEEKEQQGWVVSSFKLTNQTQNNIEEQKTYGFLDQSYFNYPASWMLKEKSILSVERMYALLYQISQDEKKTVLEGHIRINVISRLLKTTLADEVQKFLKELKIKDYTVGSLLEKLEFKYDPSIKFGKAELYKLVPADPISMKGYELGVTIMQGDDYYYIVSMITPSREQDFYTWARNMEAFRIISGSVRRHDVSVEYDPNDPYFNYMKEGQ
jgi:hypothetical protein